MVRSLGLIIKEKKMKSNNMDFENIMEVQTRSNIKNFKDKSTISDKKMDNSGHDDKLSKKSKERISFVIDFGSSVSNNTLKNQ